MKQLDKAVGVKGSQQLCKILVFPVKCRNAALFMLRRNLANYAHCKDLSTVCATSFLANAQSVTAPFV